MGEAPVKRGDVLAGKYRVDSVLGMGGMGIVVAVTHLALGERRAVKLMLPEALENAQSVDRFMREARAASRLKSEHVARVHDIGRLEDGAPYMVMEHLIGTDLRSLLRQRGRLPVSEAVHYALQACEALAEAHSLGIIHRDLKPANLFLTTRRDGSPCVKVLDFGISKIRSADDPEMTVSQAVLGSPTYMSPEQMRSSRSVDARSDIWSMGVILYRLVTGQPPFEAENLTELVALVLSTTPTPTAALVPDVPAGFDDVLLRCLQRDLDLRWSNVAELAAALAPFAPEEARGSVDRIVRLLSDAPTLAQGRRARSQPPRGPSLTHSPWASTPLDRESISMRRWTFVALAAAAAGLALSGVIAIVLSFRVGRSAAPAAQDVPDAAAALVATPPPPKASAPPPPPSALPAVEAEPAPSKPAEPVMWPRSTWKVKRAAPKPTVEPAPPPPPKPAPAPTAPNRMFGIDN